jgi:cytidine deaminase
MADITDGEKLQSLDVALIESATEVIARNYEYERHAVGAAIRMRSGAVFTGIHVEATIGRITVCAEAIALGAALSQGERDVDTIVAIAHPHPHEEVEESWVTPPCGMCRELIKDYGPEAQVIVQGVSGLEKVPVSDLLPYDDK